MKVQLLYFEGCPSYRHALENLKAVLSEQGINADVEMVHVNSLAEAQRLNFLGSPTIQIDGVDLEGADAAKAGVGYGCRVYKDGEQMRGWPSVDQIRAGLRRFLGK